ncbi:hypothetical protein T439DRAFT_376824 [Meredithblackwellia eburnea MCA 4105]
MYVLKASFAPEPGQVPEDERLVQRTLVAPLVDEAKNSSNDLGMENSWSLLVQEYQAPDSIWGAAWIPSTSQKTAEVQENSGPVVEIAAEKSAERTRSFSLPGLEGQLYLRHHLLFTPPGLAGKGRKVCYNDMGPPQVMPLVWIGKRSNSERTVLLRSISANMNGLNWTPTSKSRDKEACDVIERKGGRVSDKFIYVPMPSEE